MQNISILNRDELIDLLSDHTARLTRLLHEKQKNEEYQNLKQLVKMLAAELEKRQNKIQPEQSWIS